MLAINRRNKMGQLFYFVELPDDKTEARMGTKKVIINTHIRNIFSGFEHWMLGGKFIQDAFPMLTADEREFIQSGTTPEEWKQMFGEEN